MADSLERDNGRLAVTPFSSPAALTHHAPFQRQAASTQRHARTASTSTATGGAPPRRDAVAFLDQCLALTASREWVGKAAGVRVEPRFFPCQCVSSPTLTLPRSTTTVRGASALELESDEGLDFACKATGTVYFSPSASLLLAQPSLASRASALG